MTDILATWNQMQTRRHSVLVRYSGTCSTPAGYYTAPRDLNDPQSPIDHFPSTDSTADCSGELVLDRILGRIRVVQKGETSFASGDSPPTLSPYRKILVYNGEELQSYRPKADNESPERNSREVVSVELKRMKDPGKAIFPVEQLGPLLACGEIMAARFRSFAQIGDPIDADVFQITEESEWSRIRCVLLQTMPDNHGLHAEMWVRYDDPRQIMRYDIYGLDGRDGLWISVENEFETINGEPVLQSWKTVEYSFENEKARIYHCNQVEFQIDPDLEPVLFAVDERPGMIVHDVMTPEESRKYVVGKSGQPNVPLQEMLAERKATAERSKYWPLYGLIAAGVLLLTVALLMRHRQQIRQQM